MPAVVEHAARPKVDDSVETRAAFWGDILPLKQAAPAGPLEAALPSGYRVRIHDPAEVLEKAREHLTCAESYDRNEAVSALAALQGSPLETQARELVLGALNDSDFGVQAAACRSLKRLGRDVPEVTERLRQKATALSSEGLLDEQGAREECLDALASLGDNSPAARALYLTAAWPHTVRRIIENLPKPFELVRPALERWLSDDLAHSQKLAFDEIRALGAQAQPLLPTLLRMDRRIPCDPISILSGVSRFMDQKLAETIKALEAPWWKMAYARAAYWFETKFA